MRFLADENFDNDILRGVSRKNAGFDIIRVQETEVFREDDPSVLAWAAKEGRILLTHDVNTMIHFAYERIRNGLPLPGVFEIRRQAAIGASVEALLIVIGASDAAEYENRITYLPLK